MAESEKEEEARRGEARRNGVRRSNEVNLQCGRKGWMRKSTRGSIGHGGEENTVRGGGGRVKRSGWYI